MATHSSTKLNQLLRALPQDMVVDAAWLTDAGYSTSLRSQYVAAGWLERPARGVYKVPTGQPTWETVLASLQHLMGRSLHVGGRTALELHGFGHFLAPGQPKEVVVHTHDPLPSWLAKLPDMPRFETRSIAALFSSDDANSLGPSVAARDSSNRYPLMVSVPERAWLELLADVPGRVNFESADVIGEGLRTLRPALLENLLRTVRSVKVRRLALWFADRHAQPWRGRLDRDRIDLGIGKRSLVPNGRLDPTYLITYPRGLDVGR